jgi:hypothetical protein
MIFEDVMGDPKIRDVLLDKLAGLARHYFVSVILLVQDPKIITPKVRQNADLAAMTYQTQHRAIEALQQDYMDVFEDKHTFRKLLQEKTQDHHILIVDQTEAHYHIQDMISVDSPQLKIKKPFAIGDANFWRESGCDWREQIKVYKRIPPNDTEEWKKKIKKRWRENRRLKRMYKEEDDQREETNDINLAPPEVQQQAQVEKPKSHLQMARETVSNLYSYKGQTKT